MRIASGENIVVRVQPIVVLAMRIVIGFLLGIVLSTVGVGVAWGLFVFSGAVAQTTLLAMLMSGAGIGAGLGGFLAWLKVDGNSRLIVIASISLALLGGVGGAWGGYYYGANRELECCAGSAIKPFAYTAFGATVVANVAVLLLGIAREMVPDGRPVSR